MNTIQAIKKYILFLKENHGLSITMHPLKPEHIILESDLSSFNIHDNSYCVLLKSCPAAKWHCIVRQPKILDRLNQVSSFVGVCYAGVKEVVYPIFDGEENIGFISVSGYKAEHAEMYIEKVASEYSLNAETLKSAYTTLKEMPDRIYVDTLLYPLCKMLELAYHSERQKPQKDSTLPERAIAYIKQHRNENITSEDICRALYCSRSYMSTQFNELTGMSIREYINQLRIEDSKLLLRNSRLNITEIALSVGYSDSNYFSSVFKKITGTSPMNFRKNC